MLEGGHPYLYYGIKHTQAYMWVYFSSSPFTVGCCYKKWLDEDKMVGVSPLNAPDSEKKYSLRCFVPNMYSVGVLTYLSNLSDQCKTNKKNPVMIKQIVFFFFFFFN